jgi:hypothetical protein
MRYRINAGRVIHETIDGEVVAIDLVKGSYFSLAQGAALVWSGVEQQGDAPGIVALVQAHTDGEPALIEDHVHAFLERLVAEGLVLLEPSEQAAPLPTTTNNEAKVPYQALLLEKFDDMADLILLDPVHDIDIARGWPRREPS